MDYQLNDREMILIQCYRKGIIPTIEQLELLWLLYCINESYLLNDFCNRMETIRLFSSAQTARNVINKYCKVGIINKTGKKNKLISFVNKI